MDHGLLQPQQRITDTLLDVVEYLAAQECRVHGYAISGATERKSSTIYPVLRRLVEAGWADCIWDHDSVHARRVYALTPNGRAAAARLLAEHRPLPPSPALAVG